MNRRDSCCSYGEAQLPRAYELVTLYCECSRMLPHGLVDTNVRRVDCECGRSYLAYQWKRQVISENVSWSFDVRMKHIKTGRCDE